MNKPYFCRDFILTDWRPKRSKKLLFYGEHLYRFWKWKPKNLKLLRAEAVAQRYSVKKVFLEISQSSQENNCASGLQFY